MSGDVDEVLADPALVSYLTAVAGPDERGPGRPAGGVCADCGGPRGGSARVYCVACSAERKRAAHRRWWKREGAVWRARQASDRAA